MTLLTNTTFFKILLWWPIGFVLEKLFYDIFIDTHPWYIKYSLRGGICLLSNVYLTNTYVQLNKSLTFLFVSCLPGVRMAMILNKTFTP